MTPPELLWTPSAERIERAHITRYTRWLQESRGLDLPDYTSLWQWSVNNLEEFWSSVVEFLDVRFSRQPRAGARRPGDAGRRMVPGSLVPTRTHL